MRYYSFNTYLRDRFGERVHRLSLDAGFTCPNRDGKLGLSGCIYCDNKGFSRFSEGKVPLRSQIEQSIVSAQKRYGAQKFVAYFQSATNTYATVENLKRTYDTIREFPDIVGLYIATRPDCVDKERLDLIESYTDRYDVWVEYGLQTIHDRTLEIINRKHTYSDTVRAVKMTAERKIKVALHVILGLPGESREDMLGTADAIAALPASGVKFHMLHVLKNTPIEAMYREGKIKLLDMKDYIGIIIEFIGRLPEDRVILRLVSDAKSNYLVAPEWIKNKQEVIRSIEAGMDEKDVRQGSKYKGI